ncbi:hypothetical protein [Brevibacterium aurantiacum]|uniref:hypothetical protein n=1 Tax=Brevibacterium aurantiacum TaxID=273384 RepID=UPI0018690A81|nr:hypothetical protein [Brevibacterium aurantiacum]
MAKDLKVTRPTKKSEFELRFASRQAEKGWRDLKATIRGPLTDIWDFLTRSPLENTPANYPMKANFVTVARDGMSHQRWLHKPAQYGDARIWFYIEKYIVYLKQVNAAQPHETKS